MMTVDDDDWFRVISYSDNELRNGYLVGLGLFCATYVCTGKS